MSSGRSAEDRPRASAGPQAQRRHGAAQFGTNRLSPPPSRTLRKVLGWVFGGFGSLLLAASVICFIAWYGRLAYFLLFSSLEGL